MPINIPEGLPARHVLEGENIFVMSESLATRQDIRPLEIAIVNLMPTKIATEIQLLRLLGNTPLQVNITLVRAEAHESKNTDPGHLAKFYTTFSAIKDRSFDGMIITGAPVELLDFDEVDYWDELKAIFQYTSTHVHSTLCICWGAQAGLNYWYGIPKYPLEKKLSGVYEHTLMRPRHKLFRGFDDVFPSPHSRYTEIRREDIRRVGALEILADSDEAGVLAVGTTDNRRVFVTGHLEYDADTLDKEYRRDINKGLEIAPPQHYYPNDDTDKAPQVRWRAHAHLFFSNWLNYCVYQESPFELGAFSSLRK